MASDWVRVCRPHRDNKMASHWSHPLKVTRQLSPAIYLLHDGSRWHSCRLRRVPAPQHSTGVAITALPLVWKESSETQAAPKPAPDLLGLDGRGPNLPTPDFHESPRFFLSLSSFQPAQSTMSPAVSLGVLSLVPSCSPYICFPLDVSSTVTMPMTHSCASRMSRHSLQHLLHLHHRPHSQNV